VTPAQHSALFAAQQQIIEQIALGVDIHLCLHNICEQIEAIIDSKNAKSSILTLEGNQLRHGAAPKLPPEYCQAIDGVTIGDNVGSCGTAVYTEQQVIVSNIATSPLWANYKTIALAHGLQACWSTPIFSSDNKVLGSFAVYYTHPNAPTALDLKLIERFTHLSGLAIEKARSVAREKALSLELQRSNDKLKAFIEVIPDLGIIFDEQARYIESYGASNELQCNSLSNEQRISSLPLGDPNKVISIITKTLKTEQVQLYEYELNCMGNRHIFEARTSIINNYLLDEPNKKHVLWMIRDITERKLAEEQVKELVFYDPLTTLPNRRMLTDTLELMISESKKQLSFGTLLFLDLNDFKRINDSLGHVIGDEVLLEVAMRLKTVIKNAGIIARIGGDEFVILPKHLSSNKNNAQSQAIVCAKQILDCFKNPFKINNCSYKITVSIGISFIEGPDTTSNDVLKRADTAMYSAKKFGGHRFAFYDPALQHELDLRLQLESDIITAIKEKQFAAYFQPQLDCQGNIIAAEALIRWIHPIKGIISPYYFIPVAEQSGLIDQLQSTVLFDACMLIKTLEQTQQLHDSFCVAINISACQFITHSLYNNIVSIVDAFGISPTRFKLEITESILLDDMAENIAQMQQLKAKGFKFSIDDFGTGYSSLAYIHTYPVSELKIDKSFIDKIHEGNRGSAIVSTIISLAHNLGFNVIAEGVETAEQAKTLAQLNITGMQGYYMAYPMPAAEFISWLKQQLNS